MHERREALPLRDKSLVGDVLAPGIHKPSSPTYTYTYTYHTFQLAAVAAACYRLAQARGDGAVKAPVCDSERAKQEITRSALG